MEQQRHKGQKKKTMTWKKKFKSDFMKQHMTKSGHKPI